MMKKNISYIPMDSALEIWLLEKLLRDPPDSDCAKDLLSGIQEMIRGEVSSLLLGASEESDYQWVLCQIESWQGIWKFIQEAEKY